MAKRQNRRRIDSSELMGEGSYVILRRFTFAEIKAVKKTSKTIGGDEDAAMEITGEMLASHIVEWDWVDDEDNPLPQPKNNPDVIDQLSDEEVTFLTQELLGAIAKKKSLPNGSG